VNALCASAEMDESEIAAVGVGIPGFVQGEFISLVWEFLDFMEGSHFRKGIEESLGKPVRTDNDARTVALGEFYYGGHNQPERLLSLTLGTGVGFGFIVDGALQEKSSINHLAGHILIRPGETECYCGLSGCLESLVNAPRLVSTFKELQETAPETPYNYSEDAQGVLQAAINQHPAAMQAAQQMIDDLILGLNVYINLYAPDIFVLGGGLSKGLSPYLETIQQGLVASPFEGYQAEIRLSELGENAGLLGAASLWMDSSSD